MDKSRVAKEAGFKTIKVPIRVELIPRFKALAEKAQRKLGREISIAAEIGLKVTEKGAAG